MTSQIPPWMQEEVEEYDLDLIEPPKTILDIGANMGAFSLRCKDRWPDAIIVAFEPVSESVEVFRNNLSGFSGVYIKQSAVLANSGWLSFGVTSRDGKGAKNFHVTSGFHLPDNAECERRDVLCESAKTLHSAELVKIDTEGCEVEILENLDLSKTKAVVCEWHSDEDRGRIAEILKAAGFVLYSAIGKDDGKTGVIKFIRKGAAKPIKLFLGLPVYAQCPIQWVTCLLSLQAVKHTFKEMFGDEFEIVPETCQGDGIARSRNQLTASFLKSDCTHMLMIDCDLIFDPSCVSKLLSRNKDVIGGFYPKKQQGDLEWVINTFHPPVPRRCDGLQRVAYIGTGFIMIKRRVFEMMQERWPELRFRADYAARDVQVDFWSMAVHGPGSASWRIDQIRALLASWDFSANGYDSFVKELEVITNGLIPDDQLGRYLSEDWFFCDRWNQLGGSVWGDCCVAIRHLGPVIFPLETQLAQMNKPIEKLPKPEELIEVRETAEAYA